MKRFRGVSQWILAGALVGASPMVFGQDAAPAERQDVDERFLRLERKVEDLLAAQALQQKRLADLAEELRRSQEDLRRQQGKFVTADDLKPFESRVQQTLQDFKEKQESERKQIFDKLDRALEQLAKTPPVIVTSPPPAPTPTPVVTKANGKGRKEPPKETKETTSPPDATEESGYSYIVKSGDTLRSIVANCNVEFKRQGLKPTLTIDLVLKSNPKLKPTSMPVGKKIFIPEPPQ